MVSESSFPGPAVGDATALGDQNGPSYTVEPLDEAPAMIFPNIVLTVQRRGAQLYNLDHFDHRVTIYNI